MNNFYKRLYKEITEKIKNQKRKIESYKFDLKEIENIEQETERETYSYEQGYLDALKHIQRYSKVGKEL